MSSEETPDATEPRTSRAAVREKAQKVTARQSRMRLVSRIAIGAVAVVAVGAIGTAVTMAVMSSVNQTTLLPKSMENDGVTITEVLDATTTAEGQAAAADGTAAADAPAAEANIVVNMYVDYMSAGAGEFERANSTQLARWVNEGVVTTVYHPVALLTANSNGTRYSLRAAGAAACVAENAPEQFYDYNHNLLIDQPDAESDGRTDEELVELAKTTKVDNAKAVQKCILDQDYVAWAKEATARAIAGPLVGTKDLALASAPTVLVNGQEYIGSLDDPAEFAQFVLTVASDMDLTPETEAPSDEATPAPVESEAPAVEEPATEG